MFKNLLANPMVRAIALKFLRHGLTTGGGALVALMVAHGVDAGAAGNFAIELTGTVMTLAGLVFSMYDAQVVNKKINAAIALAPDSPPQAIAALKSGNF